MPVQTVGAFISRGKTDWGDLLVMSISDPGHRPKPMPSLGFVKMSIHRGRATKQG